MWEFDGVVVEVSGLGNVEVNGDIEPEFTYNPDDGELAGVIPPDEEPEETPEIPEESLNIIEFNYGEFEANTTYTSGEYITVEYEETKTKIKYPVSYQGTIWSEWLITKDSEGNVISTEPGDIEITDCDEYYSTYVVYDMTTDEAIVVDGVSGDSLMMYSIYNTEDDSIENAIYLAAYLNKNENTTDYHVASWNGTNYVAEDCDEDIAAITTFVETYTEVIQKQVQVKAPTVETEYVYVPMGTMKAEEGMIWAKWLESSYNTTGETEPTIKIADFEDVAYEDEIMAGESYGFMPKATLLADVVEVGDYVNYPVAYTNVTTSNNSYTASLNGWRVLSKDIDIDGNEAPGTVNLVSAGVPLNYYHDEDPNTSITNLAINFLETEITTSKEGYRISGFDSSKTLSEEFTNEYTATYEIDTKVSYPGYNTTLTGTKLLGTPKVRVMTQKDIDEVFGSTIKSGTDLTDETFDNLLAIPCSDKKKYYASTWLATATTMTSYGLCYVSTDGSFFDDSIEGLQGVRPVVSLKAELTTTGQDASGVWQLQ